MLGSSSDLLGVPRENSRVPARIALGQNYPNPFNPLTTIEFDLESRSFVTLKVFDLLGREVAALLNGEAMDGGAQRIQFSADGLRSGVYLYRIEVEAREGRAGAGAAAIRSIVRKMVLLK